MTLRLGAYNFIIKENLAQVFSCEFCEISKNVFSYRTPLVAVSSCHLYCNSKYYHSSSEAYLESCQTSMMELISENSEELEALTVFGKKTPSYMFERVLITSR